MAAKHETALLFSGNNPNNTSLLSNIHVYMNKTASPNQLLVFDVCQRQEPKLVSSPALLVYHSKYPQSFL